MIMKSIYNCIIGFSVLGLLLLNSCKKDDVEVVDVAFTANKTTVAVGEAVSFTIGSGAHAQSIYTGDTTRNFEFSRINMIENKGYTETQLKTGVYGVRLPDMKEFVLEMPRQTSIPSNIKFSGEMDFYKGTLVPWDFSNATNNNYARFKISDGSPHTITITPENAVLPGMLRLTNAQLASQRAINTNANNIFNPQMAFPDGFDTTSTTGISVRFGVQFTIDGRQSAITYFTLTVRELADNLSFNIAAAITAWLNANPTANAKAGISEIKLIVNADNPADPNDDGDLLSYKGNAYLSQVYIGSADNMIRAFDEGVRIEYIHPGTEFTYNYAFNRPGVYKTTLVTTFIGRKKYSGNGYVSGRADEVLASEYEIQRRYKTIDITVQ